MGKASESYSRNRGRILEISSRYPVRNVRIIGSVSRGDDDESSDIDLLVDALPGATLLDLGGLQIELQELLGFRVDLVTPGDIPEKLWETIRKQARPILMTHYITGYTALNINWPDRGQADWHTTSTFKPGANTSAWRIAGLNFSITEHILGDADIHDVSEFLRKRGVESPPTTKAAGYERAVFDMLHDYIVINRTVIPNIQWKDIDDAVDREMIVGWIDRAVPEWISENDAVKMKEWFNN